MNEKLVGQRMKKRRLELSLTLQEVADSVKVNKSTIQRYEVGRIKDPKWAIIESIARGLKVDPLWLTGKVELPGLNDEYENLSASLTASFERVMDASEHHEFSNEETQFIREHVRDLLRTCDRTIQSMVQAKSELDSTDEGVS